MARHASSRSREGKEEAPGRAALRLLAALSEPGMTARPDPSREDHVILQGARGGISLGRGSYPRASLEELARLDLVARAESRGAFAISEAGRARLARDRARREGETEVFGRQHREVEKVAMPEAGGGEEVALNRRESPLAWLRRRRGPDGDPLIDAAAFEAGERLRRDLTFAGLLPGVTARWDGAGGAGGWRDPAGAADTVIAARQRVRAALAAVGTDFAGLLLDLCGFLKGVETIERERRWPQRSGKIMIRLALGHLARHYGLSSEARGRDGPGRVLTWFAQTDAA